ncbi:uncharacterized protein LOC117109551 [Anneissia japonica]|uniref:uncharacterized protein LOC117109551 n=1 Tax=Anneissia japonica TaxID=1529436 RepID=UPI0014259500|nr:uncharacterized protein LOC117109551 [Anneissia japonica]
MTRHMRTVIKKKIIRLRISIYQKMKLVYTAVISLIALFTNGKCMKLAKVSREYRCDNTHCEKRCFRYPAVSKSRSGESTCIRGDPKSRALKATTEHVSVSPRHITHSVTPLDMKSTIGTTDTIPVAHLVTQSDTSTTVTSNAQYSVGSSSENIISIGAHHHHHVTQGDTSTIVTNNVQNSVESSSENPTSVGPHHATQSATQDATTDLIMKFLHILVCLCVIQNGTCSICNQRQKYVKVAGEYRCVDTLKSKCYRYTGKGQQMKFLHILVCLCVIQNGTCSICNQQQKYVKVAGEYRCVDTLKSKCYKYTGKGQQVTPDIESTSILPPQRDLDAYLLAHYAFEGNTDDVSGSSRHGELNGTDMGYIDGIVGTAIKLNGTTRVLVPSFEDYFFGNAFSVSVWFNYDGTHTSTQGIINNGFKEHGSWEIRTRSGYTELTASVNYPPAVFRYMGFTPGEWHHIAMTFNGTKLLFFLDGASQTPDTECCSVPIGVRPNRVTIGQVGIGMEDKYFYGSIDEVKLFNTSLSEEEVLTLFEISN